MPWADRFNTPTAERLIAHLSQEHRCASKQLLERLDELGLPEPVARWMGTCWKWTVALEPQRQAERQPASQAPSQAPPQPAPQVEPGQTAPPVYLIPNPERPRVCTRLDARSLGAVSADRLQRKVRDAMASGVQVGSALWVEWPIESTACADDMITLVHAALEATAKSSAKRGNRSGRHNT